MGAHYERAQVLIQQTRYAEAERELREELANNPHSGQAHAFLGRCLAQQNRMEEALEAGTESVRLAPQWAHGHYLLGLTHIDCRRLPEAEAALREALRLNPRSATHLQWLSWVRYLRGDWLGALLLVEQGLEIDPQHVGCLNYRGQYKRLLGNWSEAEQTLRESLRNDPENDFAHANLAGALYAKAIARANAERKSGEWPWRPEMAEARQHCLEALRLNPCSDFAKSILTDILSAPMTQIFISIGVLSGIVACLSMLGLLTAMFHPAGAGPDPGARDDGVLARVSCIGFGLLALGLAKGPRYLVLRWGRLGSAALSTGRRRAATATAFCLVVAAAVGYVAAVVPSPAVFVALCLSLALIQPLTAACEATPGRPRRIMVVYVVFLAAFGLLGLEVIGRAYLPLALAPVLAALLAAASILSSRCGRCLEKRFPRKTV